MKYNRIANTDLQVSNLIMGNMRLTELSVSAAEKLIRTAMEENINFFDHADIYGSEFVGQCEEHFAKAVQMNSRYTRENGSANEMRHQLRKKLL